MNFKHQKPMKGIIFVLLLFFSINTFSQTVNGVPLTELNSEYVLIVGTRKLIGNGVTIELDFGQLNKLFSNSDTRLVDANGKQVVLNSMIDALNYMSKNGYEFVDAYAISTGNQNVYHWLLRKKS
jgi:hypothetical protein